MAALLDVDDMAAHHYFEQHSANIQLALAGAVDDAIRNLAADPVHHMAKHLLRAASSTTMQGDGTWAGSWLAAEGIASVVADAVLGPSSTVQNGDAELSLFRDLAQRCKDPVHGRREILALLERGRVLPALADKLWSAVQALSGTNSEPRPAETAKDNPQAGQTGEEAGAAAAAATVVEQAGGSVDQMGCSAIISAESSGAGAPLKQAVTTGNAAAANMSQGMSLDEALANLEECVVVESDALEAMSLEETLNHAKGVASRLISEVAQGVSEALEAQSVQRGMGGAQRTRSPRRSNSYLRNSMFEASAEA